MSIAQKIAKWVYPSIFEKEATAGIRADRLEYEAKGLRQNITDLTQQITDLHPTVEAEVKAALAEQNKPKWREHCVFAFEKEGHQYHRFDSAVNLPLNRMERMQLCLIDQGHRLSPENLETLLEIIDTALSSSLSATKPDDRVKHLKNAFWAIQEIRHRREALHFSPDFLAEMYAVTIVRDDERVEVIDEQIHREKKAAFHLWGGDVDFFSRTGLGTLIPQYERLKESWTRLWSSHAEMENLANSTFPKILAATRSTTTAGD